MKLTKGVISKEEAAKLASAYVQWKEGGKSGYDWDVWDRVWTKFQKLKRGQAVLTCNDGVYIKARVTSIQSANHPDAEGPVVRVGNGEWTWRVDGCDYACPMPKEHK
jgi:hypothetical protein